eukprot:327749-Chlamydomonas_euryale.AAC.1
MCECSAGTRPPSALDARRPAGSKSVRAGPPLWSDPSDAAYSTPAAASTPAFGNDNSTAPANSTSRVLHAGAAAAAAVAKAASSAPAARPPWVGSSGARGAGVNDGGPLLASTPAHRSPSELRGHVILCGSPESFADFAKTLHAVRGHGLRG